MAKYRKALYISFKSESSTILHGQHGKNYFLQQDKSLDREYKIRMYDNRYRKALFDKDIPFIRINYLYLGNNDLPSDGWRVHHTLSNLALANNKISKELKKIEPNSIIYIHAHGDTEDDFLEQRIQSPNNNDYKFVKIYYNQISTLLAENITIKTNITIKLLACQPIQFAKKLMNDLHKKGFKNTCVIYYITQGCIYSPYRKVSKNHFLIKDYSSRDRSTDIELVLRGRFKYGEQYPDVKRVVHNYGYLVKDETSRSFKKKYMQFDNVVRTLEMIDGLTKYEEEFILLQNVLFQTLANYLDNYAQSSYPRIFHHHGSSGHQRVKYFCEQINLVSTESIVNGSTQPEDGIIRIIKEIQLFASKGNDYARFKGSINVNNNSGMTFIIKGLINFISMSEKIKSGKLKSFLNYIFDNNFRNNIDIENDNKRIHFKSRITTFEVDY